MRGCYANLGRHRLCLGAALWRSAGSWRRWRLSLKRWRLRQEITVLPPAFWLGMTSLPGKVSAGFASPSPVPKAGGHNQISAPPPTCHLTLVMSHCSPCASPAKQWRSCSPACLTWSLRALMKFIFIKCGCILGRTWLPGIRKKPLSLLTSELKDTFSGLLANKVEEYVYNAFQHTHLEVPDFELWICRCRCFLWKAVCFSAAVTGKRCSKDARRRWPGPASDFHLVKQCPSDKQASHCKQPGPQLMSKAPFYAGRIVLLKRAHMHSAADRDGASAADATATASVTFPHHTILGVLPDLHKARFRVCSDHCTLGLQMDGEEEKAPHCFCTLAWESLGIPALVTSFHSG